MRRVLSAALVGSFVFLAACSGSASPSLPLGSGAPLTLPSASPSPSASAESPSASASESPPPSGATAIPTAINPCDLLTSDQAGTVNGVAYGTGVEHDLKNNFKECVWQNSSAHASVVVQFVVAPSVTTAEADYAAAQAQAHGFSVERLTGVGDDAAIARAPAGTVDTGGIYVRKGVSFFDVVYLAGKVPPDDQLTATANIIVGELP